MKKIVLIVLLVSLGVYPYPGNHNGFSEMDSISTVIGNDSVTPVFGSKWFDLSSAEEIVVVLRFNDTTKTGYINDSCHFILGAELGMLTVNSSKRLDTAYAGRFNLDTVRIDSANCLKRPGTIDNNGIVYVGNQVDTVRVTGFATKVIPLNVTRSSVPWAHYIRYYVIGLAKNNKTYPLKLYIQNCRRLYLNVRSN
jgi:hypothetical protein